MVTFSVGILVPGHRSRRGAFMVSMRSADLLEEVEEIPPTIGFQTVLKLRNKEDTKQRKGEVCTLDSNPHLENPAEVVLSRPRA